MRRCSAGEPAPRLHRNGASGSDALRHAPSRLWSKSKSVRFTSSMSYMPCMMQYSTIMSALMLWESASPAAASSARVSSSDSLSAMASYSAVRLLGR